LARKTFARETGSLARKLRVTVLGCAFKTRRFIGYVYNSVIKIKPKFLGKMVNLQSYPNCYFRKEQIIWLRDDFKCGSTTPLCLLAKFTSVKTESLSILLTSQTGVEGRNVSQQL